MEKYDLDTILIDLSDKHGAASWTIRDAVEGLQVFGGIGSGKTSGSGRMVALKFLRAGFGGLVLTAKPDEAEMWQNYCKLTNREDDLIILRPGGKHFFNFLEYESSSHGEQKRITENIVQVLKTVIRASEEKSGGTSNDPFWETALDMLIFNVIDLCLIAYGKVSVQMMYDIVLSAPKKEEKQAVPQDDKAKKGAFKTAFEIAHANVNKQINAWIKSNLDKIWKMEQAQLEKELLESIEDAALLEFVNQFFDETYKNLSEKTRSVIEFSFSGFLFRLLKEPFYSLFCRHGSTVTPEDTLNGKIILVNLPVKLYHKVGRDSQIMFKYIWQRAMEERRVTENARPVFLWADEAQNFLHEHDPEYQATARSSRIATVYISQNFPNYHVNMGGEKSDYRVKSFLGTLATKIFHANADLETNKYASELIGEGYSEDISTTKTILGDKPTINETSSFKLEKMVRAEEFVSLKTGGPENGFRVEGYMHRQGKQFQENQNYRKITFKQNFS